MIARGVSRRRWLTRRTVFVPAASICLACWSSALAAQQPESGLAHPAARALVVRIDSRFASGNPEVGAGIIVGMDTSRVFIATAAHVVRRSGRPALNVKVSFASGDTVTALLLPRTREGLDLAVVWVPYQRAPLAFLDAMDRLGSVGALRDGARVTAVGCPGECWRTSRFDEFRRIDEDGNIVVEQGTASLIGPGSSGGALVNGEWEVVGLMILHERPNAFAIPIDVVLRQLQDWDVPVTLTRPSVPRRGYPWLVTLSLLSPSGTGQRTIDPGRLPSARVRVVQRSRGAWSLTASAYRFAPRDLGVTAGMVGVMRAWPLGTFTIRPFGEVGVGHVEGRFDAGGVTVKGPPAVYVPRWEARKLDGFGFGGGVEVQRLVVPRVMLGALVGRWSFPTPQDLPEPARLYYGLTLHYGLGS